MSDWRTLKNRLLGTLGIEEAAEACEQLTDEWQSREFAADGAAATAFANTKVFVNLFSFPLQILAAALNVDANVAADGANNGTETIYVDDGAGGTKNPAGAVNNNTTGGAWTAGVNKPLILDQTNCVVLPGACVYLTQTKTGTGTQFPIRTLALRFRKI